MISYEIYRSPLTVNRINIKIKPGIWSARSTREFIKNRWDSTNSLKKATPANWTRWTSWPDEAPSHLTIAAFPQLKT